MWTHFFFENLHFAVSLFAALVFFAVFWLYFDAWTGKKTIREGFRWAGFLLLSLSFFLTATQIESTVLPASFLGEELTGWLMVVLRGGGYVALIVSLIVDPLQSRPRMSAGMVVLGAQTQVFSSLFALSFPLFSALVSLMYLRRATVGLEHHLKPKAAAFFMLSLYEFIKLSNLLRSTTNVGILQLVSPFGPLWIVEQLLLITAAAILGGWVFGYLLKRFMSQLFMFYTAAIVAIFLVTTVTFTGLLLKSLEDETLRQLTTDVKVLEFTLDSKKQTALSDAQLLAQNTDIVTGIVEGERKTLADLAEKFLLTKQQNFLVVVDSDGRVMARGEDRERVGDSLSDDPLVKQVLAGRSAVTVYSQAGALSPLISVRAAVPVKNEEKLVGAIVVGSQIDNTFVDGIKAATGLEATIYGGDRIAATTLRAQDGKSRLLGIKESHKQVTTQVLTQGESFSGDTTSENVPYFGAYLPLKDVEDNPVGMLFVGKPQTTVLRTAGRAIEFTFISAVVLIFLALLPAYLISRYMTYQIE